MTTKKSFYQVLCVSPDSSEAEMKLAYHKLARRYHPDKNLDDEEAATEKFKEVISAYNTLSDPYKRMVYDLYGAEDDKTLESSRSEKSSEEWKNLEKRTARKAKRSRSRTDNRRGKGRKTSN
jgi:DnaJ-class molecular chaperone